MLSHPLLPLIKPFWDWGVIASTAGIIASAITDAIILFSTLLSVIGRVLATVLELSLGKMHKSPKLNSLGGVIPVAMSMTMLWRMGAEMSENVLYSANGRPSGPGDVFLLVLMCSVTCLSVGREGLR